MKRINVNVTVATLALAAISAAPIAQAQDRSGFDASMQKLEPKMSRDMRHAPVNGNPDNDFLISEDAAPSSERHRHGAAGAEIRQGSQDPADGPEDDR